MHPASFFASALSIILIDLLLAGDNALVIAMAVRHLPTRERRIATLFGAGGAVVLRVALTFIASRLLAIEFVKLAGGLFILWIAIKVLRDASDPPDPVRAPGRMLQAIWYVVFADITMSTDNILAIAGASQGNFALILFGLAVSIPFVVLSSNLLADLMNRFPILVLLGGGILGRVAGDMVMTDPWLERTLAPSHAAIYGVEAALVVLLIAGGWLCLRKRKA